MRLISAVAIALFVISYASAKPPDKGIIGPIIYPIIWCDNRDQIEEIFKQFKEHTLEEHMNGPDEPCVFDPLPFPVTFGKAEYQGKLTGQSVVHPVTAKLWIIPVTTPSNGKPATLYLLWTETKNAESPQEWDSDVN